MNFCISLKWSMMTGAGNKKLINMNWSDSDQTSTHKSSFCLEFHILHLVLKTWPLKTLKTASNTFLWTHSVHKKQAHWQLEDILQIMSFLLLWFIFAPIWMFWFHQITCYSFETEAKARIRFLISFSRW